MAPAPRPLSALLPALAAALCLVALPTLAAAPATPQSALIAEVRADSAALAAALARGDEAAARRVAAERLDSLRAVLESDPARVPALLLSPTQSAAAADIAGDAVETWLTDVEGELAVYHFDDFEQGRSWDEHVLTVDGKRYDLVGLQPLRDLGNRSRVRIAHAVRIDDAILALEPVVELPRLRGKANAYASARVLLMMVNFQDDTRTPFTKAQVESAMQTSKLWFDEGSFGTQATSYQVLDWATLPISKAGCPYYQVETEGIRAAQAAGVNVSAYNIVAFVHPNISECGWAGLGGGGNFWLNGSLTLRVITHEIGHVLGLGHAYSRRCPGSDYTLTTGCEEREYGSPFDVMGAASGGHYHAGAKIRLDYLRAQAGVPSFETVTRSGEYVILPYASATAGSKALVIPRPGTTAMHVEYRQPVGNDASLGSRIGTRVQVSHGTNTALDLTPATTSWDDASLNLGLSYDETGTGTRVQLLSADTTSARVRVDIDPCGRSVPAVQLTDLTPGSLPGQPRRLRIDVSNTDDPAQCAAATRFRLLADPIGPSATLPPSSWSPAAELTIAPGASASTELSFAIPAEFSGNLQFYLDVANAARPLLKSRPLQTLFVPNLTLERVSGDGQTAAGNQAFAQALRVRARNAAGAAVPNQSVRFTAPSGSATATLGSGGVCTTDANGECGITATARTTPGTYLVRATSTGGVGEVGFRLTNGGTAAPDTTPDAFQLPARSGVGFGVAVVSSSVRIGGINVATALSVENGEVSVGCNGSFSATATTVLNGQLVCVRHTSATTGLTAKTTTLRVGTASAAFTSTTASGGASSGGGNDTVPEPFAFAPRDSVPLSALQASAAITVRGLTAAAPVSVSGGSHSVGCTGTYTTAAGSISDGQSVCVQHTSAARHSVTTTTTLTIGGVTGEFSTTTLASTRPQTANQFDLSGAWYEPATSGQGLMIELYNSASRGGAAPYLFAGWFTYTDRVGGVAEQDWFALEGTGSVDGRVFPLTIGRPNAGVFDNGAAAGAPVQLGTATLTFSSCTQAVLDYQFNAANGSRSGQVVLQRLLSNVSCDEATPAANAPRGFLNSGAWYEPATAGQGLLFEVNPVDRQLFGAWYTFAASGPADYRWYTLQLGNIDAAATRISAVPIIETIGGRFDRNEATTLRQVGEATIDFTGCSSGLVSYRFTVGELAGRSGEIPLSRVGPAPSECR